MDFFFVLLTLYAIDFQVDRHPRRFLPKLRAAETRYAKTSRVRRRIAELEPGWKIRVLLDGEFTGLELDPKILIHYVRIVFRVESNVLCVDGVREIVGFKDLVLRHRYFGWMRKYSWNGRIPVSIDRSDSEKATKNRKGKYCQHLAPFIDIQKSSSPRKENPKANKQSPPAVEKTLEEKTVRPTSTKKDDRQPPLRSGEQTRARNLPPGVRSEEGVKLRDVVPEAPKPGRVRGDHEESPAVPRVRSREQVRPRNLHKPSNPSSGMATRQQARLRDDEPMISPQVRTLKPSNMQRGGMAAGQQARLRNDEPVNPQVRTEGDVPRPLKPSNLQPTSQQERLRGAKPPSPQVRSREQVSSRDGGMATGQEARLRDDESAAGPPGPQVRSREQVRTRDFADQPQRPSSSLQHGGMATGQQARLRVDESSTKSPVPQVRSRQQVRPGDGGMATGQQARLRGDESAAGPPGPQVRTGDFPDQPQRPSPSLQYGGPATSQRARLRDDEASTNAGDVDSFVRCILLVFALTVCIWMEFFVDFGWMVTNVFIGNHNMSQ